MKVADTDLLVKRVEPRLLPGLRDKDSNLVALRSADSSVLISLLCIHDLCNNCKLRGCTCTCHKEAEARRASMNLLYDQYMLHSMMD